MRHKRSRHLIIVKEKTTGAKEWNKMHKRVNQTSSVNKGMRCIKQQVINNRSNYKSYLQCICDCGNQTSSVSEHSCTKGKRCIKELHHVTKRARYLISWWRRRYILWVVFIILGKMLKHINLNHCCVTIFTYASNNLDCHILSCLTVPTFQNATKCAYSTSNMLNDTSRITKI